jgi:hypothetical protein
MVGHGDGFFTSGGHGKTDLVQRGRAGRVTGEQRPRGRAEVRLRWEQRPGAEVRRAGKVVFDGGDVDPGQSREQQAPE